MARFSINGFDFVTQKFAKKVENAFSRRLEHSVLTSRLLQKHFLKRFLWLNFGLNSF